MSSNIMHEIIEMMESEAHSRPTPMEYEMAYQARVAMDRIRFAIKHGEQFSQPSEQMREACLQLLEAFERLEYLDRRFQVRSRIKATLRSHTHANQDDVSGQSRRPTREPPNGR
jgi:hypothetical protein